MPTRRASSDEKARRATLTGSGAAPPQLDQNMVFVYLDDPPPVEGFEQRHGINSDAAAPINSATSALLPSTPFLDSLVAKGVRFLDAVNAPVCSPGRASWMTGVYPFRHGVGHVVKAGELGEGGYAGDLKEFGDPGYEHPTVWDKLAEQNVHTGFIGKMHFSADEDDEFPDGSPGSGWSIVSRLGNISELRVNLRNLNQTPVPFSSSSADGSYYRYYYNTGPDGNLVQTDYAPSEGTGPYHTSWMADEAISFLQGVPSGKRFFLYLATCACHSPYGSPSDLDRDFPPDDLVNTQEYIDHKDEATSWHVWQAQMEAVDTELQRIYDGMTLTQRRETTWVIMADNGVENAAFKDGYTNPPATSNAKNYGTAWTTLFNDSETRLKTSTFNWGTQAWLVWAGPAGASYGVTSPGRQTNAMVDIVDLAPTIAEYFGTSFSAGAIDGVSFLGHAQQGTGTRSTHARQQQYSQIFFPMGDHASITVGEDTGEADADQIARREQSLRMDVVDTATTTYSDTGTFHLRRVLRDGSWVEELYKHMVPSDTVTSEVQVDRWEETILDATTHADLYTLLRTAIEDLEDAPLVDGQYVAVARADGTTAYIPLNAAGNLPITLASGAASEIGVEAQGVPIRTSSGSAGFIPLTSGPGAASYKLRIRRAGVAAGSDYIFCDAQHFLEVTLADGSPGKIPSEDDGSGGRRVAVVNAAGTTEYLQLETV